MEVSITEAHRLTGVARSTIYKDIDSGKLSSTQNARGKQVVMVSELERVYGKVSPEKIQDKNNVSENVATDQNRSSTVQSAQIDQVAVLQERIEALRAKVESQDEIIGDLKEVRKDNRRVYEEQIETLREALDKAQDGFNGITKLLEDKTDTDNDSNKWEKGLKALETRIANQEKDRQEEKRLRLEQEAKARKHLQKAREFKRALEEERSKSLWKKLFG